VLEPTRIAVLYLDDESEGQNLEHLARAFTGALIDKLSQVDALDVLPRSSVKPYVKAPVSLDSLVRSLGMGTLVEGSVSGSSDRLTVSVSMIDPASQSVFESFTLGGDLEQWENVRNELAAEVARVLRQRLGGEIRLRERRAGSQSADALTLVEEAEGVSAGGWERWFAGDTASSVIELERADSLLARAESKDPNWVEPVVLRGWIAAKAASALGGLVPGQTQQGWLQRAISHAERALELNPEDPGALELRGALYLQMSQNPRATESRTLRQAAERDLALAVAVDPLRARAWARLSELKRIDTRFAEAKRDAERALEADPFLADAATVIFQLFETSAELRDMEESVRWCDEGRRRFPGGYSFVACRMYLLGLPSGPQPEVETVWALADTLHRLASPQEADQLRLISRGWVAAVLARAGLADSAVAVSERARGEASGDTRPWTDYQAAYVRLLVGQRQVALDFLSRFLEAVPQRKEYIAKDWLFEDLWGDPRFKALVSTE
jgi:TolB-like protein